MLEGSILNLHDLRHIGGDHWTDDDLHLRGTGRILEVDRLRSKRLHGVMFFGAFGQISEDVDAFSFNSEVFRIAANFVFWMLGDVG